MDGFQRQTQNLCSQSINKWGETNMSNNPQFRNHLGLAYASYMQLDDDEQRAALETTVALLRTMLRNGSGQRQQLAELGHTVKTTTDAEKARSKLTRKTNARSPKSPIKPVQATSKHELRRK